MSYFAEIPLVNITPDPDQPRKVFDETKLNELVQSIAAVGVKQPITVRLIDTDRLMIIAGERRFRASTIAGKETIPSVVLEEGELLTEQAIYAHQLNENFHREDLNPVEKAEFIQQRIDALTALGVVNPREIVASELGVGKSWLSKTLSALKLNQNLRNLAQGGKVRDYATLKRLSLLKQDQQVVAIEQIEAGQFNAKEFFSKKPKAKEKATIEVPKRDELTVRLDLNLSEFINLIKKTDFRFHFDKMSEEEKSVLLGVKRKDLVKMFKDWFNV